MAGDIWKRKLLPIGLILTLSLSVSASEASGSGAVECADGLLASLTSEFGIPGMAVAVKREGRLIYSRSIGDAHLELGSPVTPSTIFQLSSTAKIFTGIATMRLVEQGKLKLSDPVSKYLPRAPTGWEQVTVRHLLSMTARLPDLTELSSGTAEDRSEDDVLNDVLADGSEHVLSELFERATTPEPGTGWKYGSGDYFVLQQILETVAGVAFPEIVRREVFEPAGMVNATYWSSDTEVLVGSASSYYPDGSGGWARRRFAFPAALFSAGGAAASVEDLLRLDDALRNGTLLSRESIETMWTRQPLLNGNFVSYGLGWDPKDHAPGQDSFGHGGGYLTTFRRYVTGDLTVVVLTNGFTIEPRYMNPDNIATALAAVWEPSIVGFDDPGCTFEAIRQAKF